MLGLGDSFSDLVSFFFVVTGLACLSLGLLPCGRSKKELINLSLTE